MASQQLVEAGGHVRQREGWRNVDLERSDHGVVGDDNQGVIAGLRLLGHASRAGRARERIEDVGSPPGAASTVHPLRDDVSVGLTGPASVTAIIEPHVDLVLGLAALGDDRRDVPHAVAEWRP